MNSPALGHPNYQILFFLFVCEKKGNSLGVLTKEHRDHHEPIGYYSQQLYPVVRGYSLCLRAIMATLVKIAKKITVRSPLTLFVPHTVEAILNPHCTQHFSVSHLISYEVLFLIVPHITLSHCNNLNPATLLPSLTNEFSHDCLMLTDHLLTPCDDL